MAKKLIIEDIKKRFSSEDCVLLTTYYTNYRQKLSYICRSGHKTTTTLDRWRRGHRCSYCAGNGKLNIEYIRDKIEEENYILLTEDYLNSATKFSYLCPKGHEGSSTWDNWRSGGRCIYCAGLSKYTIEQVRLLFNEEGYELLSDDYENVFHKLNYKCPEGHEGNILFTNWLKGHRCLACSHVKRRGIGNPSWRGGVSFEPYCQDWTKDLKEYIKERDGYKCLNPYCDSKNSNDLVIHHIDYNKKNCGPENLITICRSCNNKANFDRKWHKAWYQAILLNKYNIGGEKYNNAFV